MKNMKIDFGIGGVRAAAEFDFHKECCEAAISPVLKAEVLNGIFGGCVPPFAWSST